MKRRRRHKEDHFQRKRLQKNSKAPDKFQRFQINSKDFKLTSFKVTRRKEDHFRHKRLQTNSETPHKFQRFQINSKDFKLTSFKVTRFLTKCRIDCFRHKKEDPDKFQISDSTFPTYQDYCSNTLVADQIIVQVTVQFYYLLFKLYINYPSGL
jgi:hypothetical protein